MQLNFEQIDALLSLIEFHDDWDEVSELMGTDIELLHEILSEERDAVAVQRTVQTHHFSSKPMKFLVSDIKFDFSDDYYELSQNEKIDIIDNNVGYWDADDEEDLIEEITCAAGYCINNINYEVILTQ